MKQQNIIKTAYLLPFRVRYSGGALFSSGGVVTISINTAKEGDLKACDSVISLFWKLSGSGALAGANIEPWRSGIQVLPDQYHPERYTLGNCLVDEGALVVLTNLFLARQQEIMLKKIEIHGQGDQSIQNLNYTPDEPSSLPQSYRYPPFLVIDDEPESGAYTFIVEFKRPLEQNNEFHLKKSLITWIEAILAGGYGLAPIPPNESYVEPADDFFVTYDTTGEWTIFKLRADPECINGIINIFIAFHHLHQEIESLTIT